MKIGLYSITYRGVWHPGDALPLPEMMCLAKKQGWEGVELDTNRPHLAPMDYSLDDRKKLRDLAGELDLPICAVSPNCDLSSPVPSKREAMICHVRECIKMAADLEVPICKVFAAWRGITLHEGVGSYEETYDAKNTFLADYAKKKWGFVRDSLIELCQMAEDYGVIIALQNHGPDVVQYYKDVLEMIRQVDSPAFKACMDLCNEDMAAEYVCSYSSSEEVVATGQDCNSADWAKKIVAETGSLLVHSHFNGEFARNSDGRLALIHDPFFKDRMVDYPAYVKALVQAGYQGYMNWEFCHPTPKDAQNQQESIEYVHRQTEMALEYMKTLRAEAQECATVG